MRDDPIISRGVLRVALILLVGGALGAGAYALASGVEIDLPELPEIETVGDETEATTIEETSLEETTLGGETPPEPPPTAGDPFSSAGLASALELLREEVGSSAQLTRLLVNEAQTQFVVRRGDGIEAYSVRADDGELTRADATVTISGNATLEDFAFGLAAVDPDAVDRMLAAARKRSGAADFEPSVLALERAIRSGSRRLEWTINARGGGRNLLYRAAADGSALRNVGGEGTPIPPAAQEAQRLGECIRAAGGDADEIRTCLEER